MDDHKTVLEGTGRELNGYCCQSLLGMRERERSEHEHGGYHLEFIYIVRGCMAPRRRISDVTMPRKLVLNEACLKAAALTWGEAQTIPETSSLGRETRRSRKCSSAARLTRAHAQLLTQGNPYSGHFFRSTEMCLHVSCCCYQAVTQEGEVSLRDWGVRCRLARRQAGQDLDTPSR
jgi:hypothetical protein